MQRAYATLPLRGNPPYVGTHATSVGSPMANNGHYDAHATATTGKRKETPMRIAAIGVGRLGLLHAQNLARRVPRAELAVVVDVDEAAARRAGELCGVPYATDYRAALADNSIVAGGIRPAPAHPPSPALPAGTA